MNIPKREVLRRYGYVFVVLIALIGCVPVALAQDWMPDANLRTAVRSALDIDADDTLTQADMEDLTSFTAKDSQINSITGLEHATELTSLDLRDNSITTISALSGLTSLKTLKLKGNSIDNISALSSLTSLTLLNLKGNDIVTITALSELTNLEHLRLDDNSITDVQPLTSLVDLEKLWISGNALTNAHLLSSLTNLTTIDITIPDPPDTTAPDVSISVSSGTQNGAFDATITFTEMVSDFVQTDLSLGGTATASITDWDTTDNTVYTASITPTTSGTLTLDIAADVATDAANNNNTAALTQTVTVDINAPTVVIDVSSGTQNGAFNAMITFSESVSNFVQGDVSLSGTATASITDWNTTDDTLYTATITPTTSGTVILDIATDVATDAADNGNTAAEQQTATVDIDKPSVTITVPSGAQNSAFDATITFSEVVSNFVQGDVSLSGTATASITDWNTTDDTLYTATITPTTSGTVTLNILADVAIDAAGNKNTAATEQEVVVELKDETDPDVIISVLSGVQNSAFDAIITFSEVVSDFLQADLSLSGTASASITAWDTTDNIVFTATITPTTSGTVILDIAADVATDAGNNGNTAATQQTVAVDIDKPSVTITVPSGAQNSAFDVTITFSEAVSDFAQADVSLSGTATATITAWDANSANTVFTATITPTTSGTVAFNIAAGVATDAADNTNTAATEQTVTIDVNAPTVTITVPSDLQTGAFDATITFSEAVSDFLQDDVSFSTNTAEASITAWSANTANTIYTATVTPAKSGRVVLSVAAGVATDTAGNDNTTGTSARVGVSIIQQQVTDTVSPGVSISVPEGVQNAAFDATITFSESVSDFVQGDVSLSGTATASITDWNTTDDTVYTATITPTTSGTVILNANADVATDAAKNGNTAATQQTVTVDVDKPAVTITVPSGTQNGTFDATITFSEAVSDFLQTDVSLSGTATASITAWVETTTDTVYTATITPTTSGTVVLDIDADVAIDAAKNGNTAATQKTVSVAIIAQQVVDQQQVLDTTAPDVSISVPSGTQNGAFDATITFSEVVSDFVQGDVSLSGTATASITGWSANNANTVYTAEIMPTTSGTVILNIATSVATDAANNPNTAATQQTVTVDVDSPSVSITPDLPESNFSPSNRGSEDNIYVNGPFDINIEFTEPVSGFEESDFIISDGEATITDFKVVDAKNYTATVSPDVVPDYFDLNFTIPAGVATDAAGNPNTRGTSRQIFLDFERHSTTISVPNTDIDTTTFNVKISFRSPPASHSDDNGYKALGFEQADLTLTNNTAGATITGWSEPTTNDDNTRSYYPGQVIQAEITVTQSGHVTFSVAEGVATDRVGNLNTASTLKTVTVRLPGSHLPEAPNVDTTAPSVSITPDLPESNFSPSNRGSEDNIYVNGPFDINIEFTEPVSGFEESDFIISDGEATITDFKAVDAKNYIATVSPDVLPQHDYFDLDFTIPTGVATDAAGNPNTRGTSRQIFLDFERHSTTISVPNTDIDTTTFNVKISFRSPPASHSDDNGYKALGFEQADLTLTNNTAGATITGWSEPTTNDDNTRNYHPGQVIQAEITVTQSGHVTFSVAEGVATDRVGNLNTASTLKTVTVRLPGSHLPEAPNVDTTAPSVSITPDLPESNFSPSNRGSEDNIYVNGPFDINIEFTEPVSGFEESDFIISDGEATITDFKVVDAKNYTATVSPDVVPDYFDLNFTIPAGVATDAAGNPNTRGTSRQIFLDFERHSTTISVPNTDIDTTTFNVKISFRSPPASHSDDNGYKALGFEQADLTLTNNTAGATITGWSEPTTNDDNTRSYYPGQVIQAEITVTQSGHVAFSVAEGVATDRVGNLNTASTLKTVTVNVNQLAVNLTVPSAVQNGVFAVITTFAEAVSDFEQSDLSLTNNTAGAAITTWVASSDQKTYTAVITPTTSGEVTFSVAEGVATNNVVNKTNSASESQTVSVDMDAPGVSISVPADVQNGAFDATITFTESVSGFEQGDLGLSGTATATITAWNTTDNTTYTAEITLTTNGTVTLSIDADVATDAAKNSNTAATSQTVNVDVDAPGVSISVPSDAQDSAFDVTITFTESVSDFVQTDLVLSGIATATITAWNTTDNTTYTAEITPTTNGTVTLSIAAGVATDAAKNSNTAATSQTVNIEMYPAWDVNEDGDVDITDVVLVVSALGQSGTGITNERTDVNGDGTVDNADVLLVTDNLDPLTEGVAPLVSGNIVDVLRDQTVLGTLDRNVLQGHLEILRTESDGSLKYLRAIALLESILDAMRPDETRLLANYPNPFNPETWMPYHLANPSNVRITIYDVRGTVVRRLDLGHQREGYYTSQGRAAYWDGRNDVGERVASGIYFYQFQADNRSLLRKMLILK